MVGRDFPNGGYLRFLWSIFNDVKTFPWVYKSKPRGFHVIGEGNFLQGIWSRGKKGAVEEAVFCEANAGLHRAGENDGSEAHVREGVL